MGFAGGLGASCGIGAESTWGTQVVPDRWFEWLDASPQLNPTYVDLAVRRWEEFTGLKGRLVTNRPVEKVAA